MKIYRFRSIRTKIFVVFLAIFLVMSILLRFALSTFYLGIFDRIEVMNVEKELFRAESAIININQRLDSIVMDWGIWDYTYDFAQGLDANYYEENVTDDVYDILDINIMMITDVHGNILIGNYMDFETETVSELNEGQISAFEALGILQNNQDNRIWSGVVIIDERPFLIATHPIYRSDGSGPAMGDFVVGRYIDQQVTDKLSDDLKTELSVEVISTSLSQDPGIMTILPKNDKLMTGKLLIEDLSGISLVEIGIHHPRDIYEMGINSSNMIKNIILVMQLLVLSLLLVVLNQVILKRLVNMSEQVAYISNESDTKRRLTYGKETDEIHDLTANINGMLGTLNKLHSDLEDERNTLEVKVAHRTDDLLIVNERLEVEIIERKKIQDEVTFLAYHDSLTGLPNRLLLTDRVEQGIMQASRFVRLMSVMFIDLDGFKVINDTLGHDQGDILLKQVADRLTHVVRKNDTVCRIGGDEFVLFINGYKSADNIEIISEKIVGCFKDPFQLKGQDYFITCSMGVAQYPIDGEDVETLMKNADMAMYEAKKHGKNQHQLCSQNLKNLAIETMTIANNLHRAIERDEMMLYYQPQINSASGEIEGVEALLRWDHPATGFISPAKFIPIAEKTRLIIPIGSWVLETACRQLRDWMDKGLKPIRMAVNFSIHQLNQPDIVEQVAQVLSEFSLEPSSLEIELTESIAMDQRGTVVEVLHKFKLLGVNLAIDDFGTEYSSLSRLKDLPVDRVKIDMSFIQGIGISDKDEAITKAVILLASNMGLTTIAEGVETKQQLDFLNNRMCDEVQGYFMYRPMSSDKMEQILRDISGDSKN